MSGPGVPSVPGRHLHKGLLPKLRSIAATEALVGEIAFVAEDRLDALNVTSPVRG
jgi:hypothetical protein